MDEIEKRVARCVAQVLALDAAALQAESRLMEDLGAESLDLVELMYLLEDEFKVRLDRSDISLTAQLGMAEEEIHHDEVLTPQALAALQARFPSGGRVLVPGATRKHLAALLTIGEISRAVRLKLQAGQGPAPIP